MMAMMVILCAAAPADDDDIFRVIVARLSLLVSSAFRMCACSLLFLSNPYICYEQQALSVLCVYVCVLCAWKKGASGG